MISSGGKHEKGSVLLSIPQRLVFTSAEIKTELSSDDDSCLQEALASLHKEELGDQIEDEFLVFLKLLKEVDRCDESDWHGWIECLPRDFHTGVCFSATEMDCLPSFSRQLADFELKKLAAFGRCADQAKNLWETQQKFNEDEEQRATLYQWAYNVVYSRCWKAADDLEGSCELVPIGDLFNHKEPASVAVDVNLSNKEDGSIDFVLQADMETPQFLSLSYGVTNPHRALVMFGFVDESMPSVFSQVVFPDASQEHIEMGCNDRDRMVYTARDGGISETVFGSVLYALLGSQPEEQKLLHEAHMKQDAATKKQLYAKYLLEIAFTLKNHVDGTLQELKEKEKAIEEAAELRALTGELGVNLVLIQRHNAFLQSVFEKTQIRLTTIVQEEAMRRRKAAAEAASFE